MTFLLTHFLIHLNPKLKEVNKPRGWFDIAYRLQKHNISSLRELLWFVVHTASPPEVSGRT